ncbi:MAG: glycoside hydrolase family 99-like domain-containing protein [Bacteroidota bacterium]
MQDYYQNKSAKKQARIFALYLPQFHPIAENDTWWGKGFTEWTNVGKARKYFKNHYQPKVPADLGYYDLRIPEIRHMQAVMAEKNGIEGFIYWHYWFGNGKRILEKPFNDTLTDNSYNFPFALAWANESWKGLAHGVYNNKILISQSYPSIEDYVKHFYALLPAFKDRRYIKVNNKPIFMIYKPNEIPDVSVFINLWNKLASDNGLSGFYFIAHHTTKKEYWGKSYEKTLAKINEQGFDAINIMRLKGFLENRNRLTKAIVSAKRLFKKGPFVYSYKKAHLFFSDIIDTHPMVIPTIISGWDNTPRHSRGLILKDYTPTIFAKHVKCTINLVKDKPLEERLIILKSWNEWAEGNYMEPDIKWGNAFLEVLKKNAFCSIP